MEAEGRAERITTDAWWWFLVAGLVATVVYLLIQGSDLQPLGYELLAGLAAAAVVVGARLHGPHPASGWLLVAGGLALWALGDLLWNAHESLFDTSPFPSIVDGIYLAGYPLLLLGILRLVRDRMPGRDVPALLDALAFTVAAALPAWIVLMSPLRDDGLSTLGRVVATAYPVADVVLVGVLVRLLVSPGRRPPAYWLLFLGITATLVADLVFAVPSIASDYQSGGVLDGLYLVSYLLVGAAALHPSMADVTYAPPRRSLTASRVRIVLVAVAGLSAPVLLAVEAADGEVRHLPLIVGGWCVLLCIVLVRLVALTHQLAVEARLDPLTRLVNRSHFLDRVETALRRRAMGEEIAILYLDLDGFKAVNESIGRAGGDALLVAVADRLRTIVRPGDLVARPGGDEFVVLCDDVADEAGARAVAARLQDGLAEPFWYDGSPHFLSASIGISRATTADAHAAGLLHDADAAMTRARTAGPSRAEIFDPDVHHELSLRVRFEHDLIHALDRHELLLHYQPLLDLRSGTVAGVEAMLRWQHPDWGMTRPESILPIAEETGLIVPIGRWVVAQACRQLRDWQRDDPATAPAEVTVNVARRELLDPGFVAHVESCLGRAGLPAHALVVDVIDDELSDAPTPVLDALRRLRALGVHVCIDRFGAGRRSLSNVRRVPADRVKVDGSLVTGVADDPGDRLVLTAVLQLGASLGLQVVAAGVETRSQRTQLERLGCTHAQGNLWAPPLPPGSVLDAVLGRVVTS